MKLSTVQQIHCFFLHIDIIDPKYSLNRNWCHEKFPTLYEAVLHTKSCMWKCKEAGCTQEPLMLRSKIRPVVNIKLFFTVERVLLMHYALCGNLSTPF